MLVPDSRGVHPAANVGLFLRIAHRLRTIRSGGAYVSCRDAASDEVAVLRQAFGAPRRASRPGRSPCSRSSRRGAAAGRDVVDAVGEAELRDGGGAVAAADDGEPLRLGDRLGHGAGAGLEARVLEHAHRAVPEHGAGLERSRRRTRPPMPGPMSTPFQPSGSRRPELADLATGVGIEELAAGRRGR